MEGERTKNHGPSKDSKKKKSKERKRKRGRKSRFTRERSLMPEGGFFAKVSGLAGDPSDSSDSSSSSSSSSSDSDSSDSDSSSDSSNDSGIQKRLIMELRTWTLLTIGSTM